MKIMTNQEAITELKNCISIYDLDASYNHTHQIHKALELAIKALENMNCGCDLCLAHNNMKCWKVGNE